MGDFWADQGSGATGVEQELRKGVHAGAYACGMQVSLVASGIGLGLIPARFLASHPKRRRLERITRSGISIEASIVFMQAGHLGRVEPAATFLQEEFRDHFAERETR